MFILQRKTLISTNIFFDPQSGEIGTDAPIFKTYVGQMCLSKKLPNYSTVTLLARFLG